MKLLFFSDIKNRWWEYLLAAVLIAGVIGVLMFVRSSLGSLENKIHDLAHKLGNNMLVLPADTEAFDFYRQNYTSDGMPESYPEQIQASELGSHIRFNQTRLYGNVEVKGVPVVMVGENGMNPDLYGLDGKEQAVLNRFIAEKLSLRKGDEFKINGIPFMVSQVAMFSADDFGVGMFTSLTAAQRALDKEGKINAMRLAGCWCRLDVMDLSAGIEKLLPGAIAITRKGMLNAQQGTIRAVKKYSAISFAAAAFIIAGIIMIWMVLQFRRQIKEIGLLMAIGVSSGTISRMLLLRAAFICAIGIFGGYILGSFWVPYFTRKWFSVQSTAQAGLPFLLVIGCFVIAMTAVIIPVLHMTKKDPVEILRKDD